MSLLGGFGDYLGHQFTDPITLSAQPWNMDLWRREAADATNTDPGNGVRSVFGNATANRLHNTVSAVAPAIGGIVGTAFGGPALGAGIAGGLRTAFSYGDGNSVGSSLGQGAIAGGTTYVGGQLGGGVGAGDTAANAASNEAGMAGGQAATHVGASTVGQAAGNSGFGIASQALANRAIPLSLSAYQGGSAPVTDTNNNAPPQQFGYAPASFQSPYQMSGRGYPNYNNGIDALSSFSKFYR